MDENHTLSSRITPTGNYSVGTASTKPELTSGVEHTHAESSAPPRLSKFWTSAIIAGFFAVNLFLIFSTVLVQHNPGLPFFGRFNLGVEHNIAVWWSTATLFLVALLFYTGQHQSSKNRIAGIVVATVIAGLSLDELGSLHARVMTLASWQGLAPFALIGGVMLAWSLKQWLADPASRPSALLLLAGFVCFGSVVGQEFLEHNVNWPAWAVGIRTGIEEGIELAGALFCLLAALRFHAPSNATSNSATSIQRNSPVDNLLLALNRFSLLPELLILASLGLAVHTVASFVTPALTVYKNLGNPAMWYPTCAWALVSFIVLRRILSPAKGRRQNVLILLALLALFTLLSMAHTVFAYPAASLDKLITRNVIVLVLGAAALVLMGLSLKHMAVFTIPALLLAGVYLISGSVAIGFLASGVFAFAAIGGFIYLDRTEAPGAQTPLKV